MYKTSSHGIIKIMKISPKYVFMHLLMVGTLYISAISFILLLHEYINYLFPDQLSFYLDGILSAIRSTAATLIVIFPVFLFSTWLLNRDFRRDPALKQLRLRKWLIYLTLFVAGVAIISGLVGLVMSFLNGELTVRFLLKVLAIFLVTGGGFGYYLADIKELLSSATNKIIALISAVIVVAAIASGFLIIGSPFAQRQIRLDQQRVYDLQIVQGELVNYWTSKGRLPARLSDLEDSIRGFVPPIDPESGQSYEYLKTGDSGFQLCATFKAASLGAPEQERSTPKPIIGFDPNQNWQHAAGRVCFDRAIDPELFPIRPKF